MLPSVFSFSALSTGVPRSPRRRREVLRGGNLLTDLWRPGPKDTVPESARLHGGPRRTAPAAPPGSTRQGGGAHLPDPGKVRSAGNFPRPGVRGCPPRARIKGVRRARGATEPARPAPRQLSRPRPRRPAPSTEHHGPLPAAAPRRAAAPAPGRVLPARSRCDSGPGPTGAEGGDGVGAPGAGPAPLTESVVPAGAPVVSELRCQCLQTLQGIHFRNIQSVKVTPPGPHCGQTEVM